MTRQSRLAEELIAKAAEWEGFRAGIANIDDVLNGPSYSAAPGTAWRSDRSEQSTQWLPNARSLLVLSMHHPSEEPRLDWFDRGNTAGNRRMTEVSEAIVAWLLETHGVRAQALPYQVTSGGVFLKDAAALAGLGVIGRNNLLLDRRWGAKVRLRSVLIEDPLPASGPLSDFDPCRGCAMPCRRSCPEQAFKTGRYQRPACVQRLEEDRAHPIASGETSPDGAPVLVTQWCRRCELECPAGEG